MPVTQKVTLYNNKFTVPPVINAVQNDTDRQIEAYFGDFTLQVGMTGKLSFIRSDGTHYEVSATLSTVNNTATAELDQALTQAGVTQAQLKITDSGNVGSTFTFIIKVQPDVAGISQQQDGYSVEEIVQRLTDAENAIDAVEEDVADLQDKEYDYAPVITDTATGTIASFSDGADGYPMRSVVAEINPVQSGSGDPSPDNIRPITGFSEAKVTRTGKNLLNNTAETVTKNGVTFTVHSDGTVTVNGTATDSTELALNLNAISIVGDYIVSGSPSSGSTSDTYWMNFKITVNGTSIWMQEYGTGYTVTNGTIQNIGIYVKQGATANNVLFKPMIRLASDTDPTYEPYKGQTYTISLGDTRYGAVLDVTRGKLIVDRASVTANSNITVYGPNAGWTNQKAYGWALDNAKMPSSVQVVPDFLECSHGSKVSMNNIIWSTDMTFRVALNGGNVQMPIEFASTVSEAKQWMIDNNIQVVYELATPIEVDVDPETIKTVDGINNIFADTGDVEITYCADTKRYIQKLISQLA